jgi:pimeloyl-ACP methyl ester carboxylesterase
LKIDAETAIRYIFAREELRNSPIVLYGQSLGGAVAIYLAEKHQDEVLPFITLTQIDAVVIENTFTDMPAIARKYPSTTTKLTIVSVFQDCITWHHYFAPKNGAP